MESSFDISTDDRERIIARAEQDKAFAAVGRVLSELVDMTGLPEDEIANALLHSDELILLFRLYRTAADVTRRLLGEPPKERLTEEEWTAKLKAQQIALMQGMANASSMHPGAIIPLGPGGIGGIGGRANMIPPWRSPSSVAEEPSGWKDRMSEYFDRLMK